MHSKASILKKTLRLTFDNYFNHYVRSNSAALAYYLFFALFPLLIFLSNLIGILDLNVYYITQTLGKFLPVEIVSIIESYLDYVTNNSSKTLLIFSLIFSIWFPMRAVQGLMDSVRRAFGYDVPKSIIIYMLKQLFYTVVLLVVIFLSLLFTVLGRNILTFINSILPPTAIQASDFLLHFWQYMRFLLIAILMFAAIWVLYIVALEYRPPIKQILPGILLALPSWLIVSGLFSFYVENFAQYTAIYGTLGAVIILFVWLYMTAVILILGAELNASLATVLKETKEDNKVPNKTENIAE